MNTYAIKLSTGKFLTAQTNALPAPPREFLSVDAAERAIQDERRKLIRYGYSPAYLDSATVIPFTGWTELLPETRR